MGSVWVAPGRPAVVQANSPSQQASPAQELLSALTVSSTLSPAAIGDRPLLHIVHTVPQAGPERSPAGYLVGNPRLIQPQNGVLKVVRCPNSRLVPSSVQGNQHLRPGGGDLKDIAYPLASAFSSSTIGNYVIK